ncbi:MAG: trypsin-like peptidase domain-containing protein [Oligoflexales bacterium]|nr:trypsin-like peptidase domain-containing protein [Oligoflexales bacterium]
MNLNTKHKQIFKKSRQVLLLGLLLLSSGLSAYEIPSASTPSAVKADASLLKTMSVTLGAISEVSKKALVYISVSKTMRVQQGQFMDPFDIFGFGGGQMPPMDMPKQEGLGSGFFIDTDQGYIMTNNHVVEEADDITCKLANGKVYKVKVLGRDKNTDVAVLKVADEKFDRTGLTALVLDDSDKLSVGALVLALGAPFGLEASISLGVVSAVGRGNLHIARLGNFVQTDVAINPGNSGGPLINMDGKVVGINTAILSKSGAYNGIGLSVPSNIARSVASGLINDGRVNVGFVGIAYHGPLKEEEILALKLPKGTGGFYVSQVVPGGPAEKAGVEEGDVIVAINDTKVGAIEGDLANLIGFMKPGEKARMSLYRETQLRTITVTVGQYPQSGRDNGELSEDKKGEDDAPSFKGKAKNPYGIIASPITPALKKQYGFERKNGLVIVGVVKGSPAWKASFVEGDVIVAVNGHKFNSIADFDRALNGPEPMVLLHVERKGTVFFVPLRKNEK